MRTRALDVIALTLIILGAINWGLIGFFQFDLIASIFGGVDAWFSRAIYVLYGLAGIYCLTFYNRLDAEVMDTM